MKTSMDLDMDFSNVTGNWLLAWVILLVVFTIVVSVLVAYSRRVDTKRLIALEGELGDTVETTESLRMRLGSALAKKDHAYEERNYIVTLLAALIVDGDQRGDWKLWKGHTPEFEGWEGCLYIQPPEETGLKQMSWHFASEHQWMLDSLKLPDGPPWDGRSAEEKYENIKQYLLSR